MSGAAKILWFMAFRVSLLRAGMKVALLRGVDWCLKNGSLYEGSHSAQLRVYRRLKKRKHFLRYSISCRALDWFTFSYQWQDALRSTRNCYTKDQQEECSFSLYICFTKLFPRISRVLRMEGLDSCCVWLLLRREAAPWIDFHSCCLVSILPVATIWAPSFPWTWSCKMGWICQEVFLSRSAFALCSLEN